MVKAPTKRRKAASKPRKTTKKTPVKGGEQAAPPARVEDLTEPFAALRRDIDQVFEDFTRSMPSLFDFDPFRPFGPVFDFRGIEFAPKVEVTEDKKAYEITAELPGVDEADVNLTLQDDVLTFSGEKKSQREEKKKGYQVSERSYGSFRRSFRLPNDVDADQISAKFDKGVVTITLPRTARTKSKDRSIPVK
jgi:HSP20 family protein